MCGRFVLTASKAELMLHFKLIECPDLAPNYNLCPMESVPVIRQRPNGDRVAHLLQWGLVPNWSKDPAIANKLFMARAETITEKPSFKAAFRKRRCVIPANGFYEWQQRSGGKQPYYVRSQSESVLSFAGVWERWTSPEGEVVDSFALITTSANAAMEAIHERMPVILCSPEAVAAWLDPGSAPDLLQTLLVPCAPEAIRSHPVSKDVGNTRNNRPDLIDPIEP